MSTSVPRLPKAHGGSSRSWRSVLVGATSSQSSGTRENAANTICTRISAARPSQAPGDDSAGNVTSGALKQASAEHEVDAEGVCDDEQHQRDRSRAVEVALLERIEFFLLVV